MKTYNHRIASENQLVHMGKEMAGFTAADMAASKALGTVGIQAAHGPAVSGFGAKAAQGLKGFGLGTAGFIGAEALMAGAEEAQGPVRIYESYLSDYNKDLDAIAQLFPQDQNLMYLIEQLRKMGNDGLQKMQAYGNKLPTLTDIVSTGANTAGQMAQGVGSMVGIKPAQAHAVYNNKNQRLAIVGQANWGSYLHQFLSGAAMGAGGGAGGAAVSGTGMALWDAAKDVWHNFQSKQYKAAAYSNELVTKSRTMINQLKKADPQFAGMLSVVVIGFNNYVKKYINKESNVADPKLMNMLLQKRQQQMATNPQQPNNFV
jgi:hypothetical protein